MSIELKNERTSKVYEYDLDTLTKEEAKALRDLGLKEIVNDDMALINYAVNFQLKQYMNELDGKVNMMKDLAKIKKNKKVK